MKLGNYQVKLEKKLSVGGWEAAGISILAILIALILVSVIFLEAKVNPLDGFTSIFTYAFADQFGIPLTINRSIFILLCTCAFIVPSKAGLWNIGMAGQLYGGALAAFGVAYAFGAGATGAQKLTLAPGIIIPLMMIGAAIGGALVGAIPGFLKGRFNTNEIVVTMMLNSVAFWIVAFMIKDGGLFMGAGGEGEGFILPKSLYAPQILGGPYTILLALLLAGFLYFMFAKMKIGYQIKTYGLSPSAAKYAGISPYNIPLLVFIIGGLLAGLAGYHLFAANPGVYKITQNYGDFGDLSFYGIICGLISLENPLAAIPIALLFGGLTSGARYVQGMMRMGFGVDYAMLGILMITLVAFQFFYRNKIVWMKSLEKEKENA